MIRFVFGHFLGPISGPVRNGSVRFIFQKTTYNFRRDRPRTEFNLPSLWTTNQRYGHQCHQDQFLSRFWNLFSGDKENNFHKLSRVPKFLCTAMCNPIISKTVIFERVFFEVNENVFGIKTNGMSCKCVWSRVLTVLSSVYDLTLAVIWRLKFKFDMTHIIFIMWPWSRNY